MNLSIHIDTITMELFIGNLRDHRLLFLNLNIFLCLKIVCIAINADLDEMLHCAVFQQVSTIGHSTFLKVSRLKRVNNAA